MISIHTADSWQLEGNHKVNPIMAPSGIGMSSNAHKMSMYTHWMRRYHRIPCRASDLWMHQGPETGRSAVRLVARAAKYHIWNPM